MPVVELDMPIPPVFSQVKLTTPGFERHQLVVAASIQRKILYLLFATRPEISADVTLTTGASASP